MKLCRLCGVEITRVVGRTHMVASHGPEYEGCCPLCPEKDIDDIRVHLRVKHYKEKPYYCDICPAVSFGIKSKETHARSHQKVKKDQCDICGRWFSSANELEEHKLNHSVKADDSKEKEKSENHEMKCNVCDKVFFSHKKHTLKQKLERHMVYHRPKVSYGTIKSRIVAIPHIPAVQKPRIIK